MRQLYIYRCKDYCRWTNTNSKNAVRWLVLEPGAFYDKDDICKVKGWCKNFERVGAGPPVKNITTTEDLHAACMDLLDWIFSPEAESIGWDAKVGLVRGGVERRHNIAGAATGVYWAADVIECDTPDVLRLTAKKIALERLTELANKAPIFDIDLLEVDTEWSQPKAINLLNQLMRLCSPEKPKAKEDNEPTCNRKRLNEQADPKSVKQVPTTSTAETSLVRTITTVEIRQLLKDALGKRAPAEQTIGGWTRHEKWPHKIGDGKTKTYPRLEVLEWLRVQKGLTLE